MVEIETRSRNKKRKQKFEIEIQTLLGRSSLPAWLSPSKFWTTNFTRNLNPKNFGRSFGRLFGRCFGWLNWQRNLAIQKPIQNIFELKSLLIFFWTTFWTTRKKALEIFWTTFWTTPKKPENFWTTNFGRQFGWQFRSKFGRRFGSNFGRQLAGSWDRILDGSLDHVNKNFNFNAPNSIYTTEGLRSYFSQRWFQKKCRWDFHLRPFDSMIALFASQNTTTSNAEIWLHYLHVKKKFWNTDFLFFGSGTSR